MEGQQAVHEISMSLHSMQAVFSIMHVGVLKSSGLLMGAAFTPVQDRCAHFPPGLAHSTELLPAGICACCPAHAHSRSCTEAPVPHSVTKGKGFNAMLCNVNVKQKEIRPGDVLAMHFEALF